MTLILRNTVFIYGHFFASNYLLKVNDGNADTRYKIRSWPRIDKLERGH